MLLPRIGLPNIDLPGWLRRRRRDDAPRAARSPKSRPVPQAFLQGYTQDRNRPSQVRARRLVWISLLGFCLFNGLSFAFFAPYLMIPFAIIPVILLGFVIWALPDTDSPPTRTLAFLLFAFVVALVGWPNYVALDLPGLPWITMARLTGWPLALMFLVCLSTSADVRGQIQRAWRETPVVRVLFLLFLLIQLISLVFSTQKAESVQKLLVAQSTWTAVFFASIYIFSKPGRAEAMAKVMWAMAIFVGIIGLFEWRAEHVLWAGHIPSFLKIGDESVMRTLAGSYRLHSGPYRVVSTFSTPLGLGEYMALTMPIVLHFAMNSREAGSRVAARSSVPFILLVAFVSGSRLGMVGCLLALIFSGGLWALLRYLRSPGSLVASIILFVFPVFAGAFFAATIFIGRIHHIVWGTGAQAYSDQARQGQLDLGIPLILKHPWGYGIGRAGQTLGFAPFGALTIDNYYLSIVLDYGVIGFICYYGFFVAALVYFAKRILAAPFADRETSLLTGVAISLTNFIIIKSVFSEEDNHPLVFMLLGMGIALLYRARVSTLAAVRVRPPVADDSSKPRPVRRGQRGAAQWVR